MTPLSRPELEELERLHKAMLADFDAHGSLGSHDEAFIRASRKQFPRLLASADFAGRALELLQAIDRLALGHGDCPCCRMQPSGSDDGKLKHLDDCALAELLRSLPTEPAKEKPDAP